MLSEHLRDTFISIASEATEMVLSQVDRTDLTGAVDYASIYAQSPEEFESVSYELKNNGTVALERPSGNYYLLDNPLAIPFGTISHCRVRMFDREHPERGYVDFEPTDYQAFKDKYLLRPSFSLLDSGEEMVELRDLNYNVRAYFPSVFA